MEKEVMSLREEANEMAKLDPGAVAAAESAKARIQSAFIMAMKNPRSVEDARARILESCKRTEFAKTVEYHKPIGGKKIPGKSIRFAEEAARAWKNLLTSTYVVHEDEALRRITIIVTDLEANLNHSQEIIVMKTVERKKPSEDREVLGQRINSEGEKVFIVRATDEEVQTKENGQISRILRNEILRMIPSDIQEEAVALARHTLAENDKKDPTAAKKQILDSFQSIGIWPKDVEAYLKHKVDNLSPKELEDLREVFAAIKTGESTWRDFMEQVKEEAEGSGDQAGTGSGKAVELTDAEKAEVKRFDDALAAANDVPKDIFQKYLEDSAQRMTKTIDRLKIMALADWKNFWTGFNRFLKQQQEAKKKDPGPAAVQTEEKKGAPAAGDAGKKETAAGPKNGPKGDPAGTKDLTNGARMVNCPDRPDTQMSEKFCRTQCFKPEECKPYQTLIAGGK
jgi:hypothetical protein